VTAASSIAETPLLTPSIRIARRRARILLAIAGLYFFVAFALPILTDQAGLLLLRPTHWWVRADRFWLCGCGMLIAGWMALGSGRFVQRFFQGLVAASWLLLAWMLGVSGSPNWKPEIEVTALVAAIAAAAMFIVLLVARRWSGQISAPGDPRGDAPAGPFQYSLATLLVVMLLLGLTLGLVGWIDPRYRHYFQEPNVQMRWSWNRQDVLGRIGSEALTAFLMGCACLPVFLSRRKRAIAWAMGLSWGAFAIAVVKDGWIREQILIPLVQGKPVDWWDIDYALIPYGVNWGTLVLCLLAAAVAMHWLGYRLAGGKRLRSANQLLDT
jgi:hypothetical protein